ncbi:hypothetical protein OG802_03505 [Streptomyces sp. NBC_00704]|uniref:hypothetical protein n=1 Tax=Streptomyces sp. NBC_00704 TaxID=2975809 RepID=UPI002E3377A7|nr:hypothetical protein [Streptomyces sp. NBC_00704]
MSEPSWKTELRSELDDAASTIERGSSIQGGIDYGRQGLESTVFEALDAAYQRGEQAGSSRMNYRLVQENERLRRELGLAQQSKRREEVCPTCLSAIGASGSTASADETPEGAAS